MVRLSEMSRSCAAALVSPAGTRTARLRRRPHRARAWRRCRYRTRRSPRHSWSRPARSRLRRRGAAATARRSRVQGSAGVLPRHRLGRARGRHGREDRSLDARAKNGTAIFSRPRAASPAERSVTPEMAPAPQDRRGHGQHESGTRRRRPVEAVRHERRAVSPHGRAVEGDRRRVLRQRAEVQRDERVRRRRQPRRADGGPELAADLDAAAAQGIVYYSTHHGIAHMWVYQATHKSEASYIPPSQVSRRSTRARSTRATRRTASRTASSKIRNAARFDPGTLLCRNGDAPTCLTAPQVEAVRTIYTAPVHARTGQKIYGSMPPGGELGWEAMAGPTPYPFAPGFYRQLVFDENWDYKTHPVNFDTDVDKADAPEHLVINANNPDVSKFIARGGKLMIIGGLERSHARAGQQRGLLRERGEEGRRHSRSRLRPPLHGAGNGSLPRRELPDGADCQTSTSSAR